MGEIIRIYARFDHQKRSNGERHVDAQLSSRTFRRAHPRCSCVWLHPGVYGMSHAQRGRCGLKGSEKGIISGAKRSAARDTFPSPPRTDIDPFIVPPSPGREENASIRWERGRVARVRLRRSAVEMRGMREGQGPATSYAVSDGGTRGQ